MGIESKIIKINTGMGPVSVKSFEIMNLVGENNPILNSPCIPFDFSNPIMDPVYLGLSLFETMFHNKGLGLTANQVGLPWSVFVVGSDQNNKQIFFNPEIVEIDNEEVAETEGCLSFPNLFFKVKRAKSCKISYQHVNAEKRETIFTGITARIVLHEMDHILGKTFLSKVGKTTLLMSKEKRKKIVKKKERHEG